jgi:hypothetical protein
MAVDGQLVARTVGELAPEPFGGTRQTVNFFRPAPLASLPPARPAFGQLGGRYPGGCTPGTPAPLVSSGRRFGGGPGDYEVARLVIQDVIAHRAGDLADDVTVVCLDWRGPAS